MVSIFSKIGLELPLALLVVHVSNPDVTVSYGQWSRDSIIWSVITWQYHMVSDHMTVSYGQWSRDSIIAASGSDVTVSYGQWSHDSIIWSVITWQYHMVGDHMTVSYCWWSRDSIIWSVITWQYHMVNDHVSYGQWSRDSIIWSVIMWQYHMVSDHVTLSYGQLSEKQILSKSETFDTRKYCMCPNIWRMWFYHRVMWATTWQNEQKECAPSKDSDQRGHPPSLIRVFAVCLKKAWVLSYPLNASEDSDQTGRMPRLIWVFTGRTLILLVLSCRGSCVLKMQMAWTLIRLLLWVYTVCPGLSVCCSSVSTLFARA